MEHDFLGVREQMNILKGSPGFPHGTFQTEIRVPYPQSH